MDQNKIDEIAATLALTANYVSPGNTTQLKAEQYVREKCPELMELSFGCEVARHPIGGYKYIRRVGNSFETGYADAYVLRDTKVEVYPAKDLKIIGHPIQLHHWLRVLHKETGHKVTYSTSYKGGGYIQISCLTAAQVKAQSTLIGFDVNDDGQPAAEADYQAFLDIVGV